MASEKEYLGINLTKEAQYQYTENYSHFGSLLKGKTTNLPYDPTI